MRTSFFAINLQKMDNEVSQELDWRDYQTDDYDQRNSVPDQDETQVSPLTMHAAATLTAILTL